MISNYAVSSSYVQNCTMSLMNLYLQGRDKIIQDNPVLCMIRQKFWLLQTHGELWVIYAHIELTAHAPKKNALIPL